MIYLFDDSTYRGINPLDFTDCLCVVDRISLEQLSRMEPALQGASCIMIHKSYRDAGGQTANVLDRICDDITDYGDRIPLVLFSDGDVANRPVVDSPSFISSLKKSEFYQRLPAFLENYRSTNRVSMELLASGDSPDVQAAVALGRSILTSSALRFIPDDANVDVSLLPNTDIIRFLNFASPAVGITPEDLEMLAYSGLKAGCLKQNIRKIITSFSEYGQNLHHWE